MKYSKFKTLSSNLWRKTTLTIIFTVPFTIEIFIIVGLVGFLSYRNGREAVNDIASQLREKITLEIERYIESQLSAPILIQKLNADAIERGELSFDSPLPNRKTYHYLWQTIGNFDRVSRIGFAYQNIFLNTYL